MMRAALYARFSTEKQSEASIDDQFRVCERLAARHGFNVVATFSDAAISGGTVERPGYRALLQAARRHQVDVIVAEDTSRLWRLLAEQAPRLAELADLGVHVVTHDVDTRQESAAVMSAVLGSMAEQYRKEIGRRTRRGLEGRARIGKCAGGRAYGYVPPAMSASGQIEIEPQQAQVVREIYSMYAGGWSPKAIAAELNRRGVASPGAAWHRTARRPRGWMVSAIAGDARRGLGILNNSVYCGRVVWNRIRWVRSAADSSKRRCVPNPPSEWVTREEERLRIVPQVLWDRVKARQQHRMQSVGAKVKVGVARDRAQRTGRDPKYPFSGLLKCGHCGANFVMAGKDHYACASRMYGGTAACDNDVYLRRTQIEHGLVAGIRRELSVPEVIAELQRRVRQRLKKDGAAPDNRAQTAKLEREVAALVEAIATGALRASPAIAQRLAETEATLARLKVQPVRQSIEQLLPQLAERSRFAIENLEKTLAVDPRRGRMELAEHVGPIRVRTTPEEIILEASRGHMESVLLAATGTGGARQISVVAGAGFEPATFGL
jgi:site-specific DNA recombinase